MGRLELGDSRTLLQLHEGGDLNSGALERLAGQAVARLKDGATQRLQGPAAVPVCWALWAAVEV